MHYKSKKRYPSEQKYAMLSEKTSILSSYWNLEVKDEQTKKEFKISNAKDFEECLPELFSLSYQYSNLLNHIKKISEAIKYPISQTTQFLSKAKIEDEVHPYLYEVFAFMINNISLDKIKQKDIQWILECNAISKDIQIQIIRPDNMQKKSWDEDLHAEFTMNFFKQLIEKTEKETLSQAPACALLKLFLLFGTQEQQEVTKNKLKNEKKEIFLDEIFAKKIDVERIKNFYLEVYKINKLPQQIAYLFLNDNDMRLSLLDIPKEIIPYICTKEKEGKISLLENIFFMRHPENIGKNIQFVLEQNLIPEIDVWKEFADNSYHWNRSFPQPFYEIKQLQDLVKALAEIRGGFLNKELSDNEKQIERVLVEITDKIGAVHVEAFSKQNSPYSSAELGVTKEEFKIALEKAVFEKLAKRMETNKRKIL